MVGVVVFVVVVDVVVLDEKRNVLLDIEYYQLFECIDTHPNSMDEYHNEIHVNPNVNW